MDTQRWEYKVVNLKRLAEVDEWNNKSFIETLNNMGKEGWQVCAFDYNTYLFKRLIIK